MTPLAELIVTRAKELALSRKTIVTQLGYSNINKAYRRYDKCVNQNDAQFHPDFLQRLVRVLQIDVRELTRAIEQTVEIEKQLEKARAAEEETRERASFIPHLWAKVEREPGLPIFVVAFTGENRWRRVDLPDGIEKMLESQQAGLIGNAARRHFEERKGDAGPFKRILGYWYRQNFDRSWLLNTDGEVLDRNCYRIYVGKYSVGLKNNPSRDISFLFNKRKM